MKLHQYDSCPSLSHTQHRVVFYLAVLLGQRKDSQLRVRKLVPLFTVREPQVAAPLMRHFDKRSTSVAASLLFKDLAKDLMQTSVSVTFLE